MNFIKEKLESFPHNKHYLNRYINFINGCKTKNVDLDESTYTEIHHILPKSVFPEHSNCRNNLIKLTYHQHLLSHYILAKIYEIPKLWYCVFSMYNNKKNTKQNRKILIESRKKHKKYISDLMINTVSVRDTNTNKTFRCSIYDERYINGTLVSANKGIPTPNETKTKISKTLKGRPKSEESKEKIRIAHKNGVYDEAYKKISNANKGKKKPIDFGDKISKAVKGRHVSIESRYKMSLAKKGKKLGSENVMANKENRDKVSQSKIGRRKVHLKDGGFKYIKQEELNNYYLHSDNKYYDFPQNI